MAIAGPIRKDFTGARALMRGDRWNFSASAVAFDDGRTLQTAGMVVRLTIKESEDDADPGVAQIDSDAGTITITSATAYSAPVLPATTELIAPGIYWYDTVIDCSATESYTHYHGKLEVLPDITRTRS